MKKINEDYLGRPTIKIKENKAMPLGTLYSVEANLNSDAKSDKKIETSNIFLESQKTQFENALRDIDILKRLVQEQTNTISRLKNRISKLETVNKRY